MKITFRNCVLLIALSAFTISCGPTLAQRKDDADIHYRLGTVYFNEGKFTDSLKELTKAVEVYPDDPAYHNMLGLAYFAREMNAEAIKEMKKAISLDPKLSDAHVNLAMIYLVEQKWDDAIRESREALKNIFYRTPEYAHLNIGWGYYYKGEYPKALENFKKAVELNPNYEKAYYGMGLTLEKTNNLKDAADAYEKAVKSYPNYIDAQFSLGVVLIKQKDKTRAMKAFEKVIELAPESDKAQSARDYINLIK